MSRALFLRWHWTSDVHLCCRYWRPYSIARWVILTRLRIAFLLFDEMGTGQRWAAIRVWFVPWRMGRRAALLWTVVGSIIGTFAVLSAQIMVNSVSMVFFAAPSRPPVLKLPKIDWNPFPSNNRNCLLKITFNVLINPCVRWNTLATVRPLLCGDALGLGKLE